MSNIIYGVHPIIEALKQNKTIDKLFIQNGISQQTLRLVRDAIRVSSQNVHLQYVPIEKLNRLSKGAAHQGLVAQTSIIEYQDYEQIITQCLDSGKQPFILFLDHITDVRNLGAIARSCECAGVDCIILPNEGSAPINADAIKTSAGALNKIPICKSFNTKSTLNFLKQNSISIYAATEKANKTYTQADMRKALCLVMGAEDKGLSKEVLKLCDEFVKIPMQGEISSLNVSVATGILLFEVLRQRNN